MRRILTQAATGIRGKLALAALGVLAAGGVSAAAALAHPDVPAPVITAKPATPTSSTGATFRFTDSHSAATFRCSLDGSPFAACQSPVAYTVASGSHTFRVKAIAAAQESPVSSYSWAVDRTPPPAPVIVVKPSDPSSSSAPSFWFADAEAGVSFQCSLDSGTYTSCASPTSYFGLAPGTHTFSVRAGDLAGNLSDAVSHTWGIVPQAPTIFARPASPTNQTAATFSFGPGLSGPSLPPAGVTFQCSLDGSAFAACTSPKSYAGPLVQGSHTFRVKAVSGSLQSSVTAYTWTVDTTAPPVPTITAKPASPSDSTNAGFSFTDAEPGVRLLCKLDGGSATTCSSPTSYSQLAQGSHRFAVSAIDAAGNPSAEASWTWTVDTLRPPAPVLTQRPEDRTGAATSTFAWTDAESGVSFVCRIADGAWQACASPYTYVADSGQNRFAVRAVDAAGNFSDATTFKWSVRESRPVAFGIAGAVGGLTPGVWKPIAVTVTNPNDVPIFVTALTVSVSAQSTPTGCASAANVELQQPAGLSAAPVMVPAHGSATVPAARQPRIRLRDLPTNQDVCKGKSFALSYGGTASN